MKNNPRFWANLIVLLPLLLVMIATDYLPAKVAVHFAPTGQADQFITRTAWLESLLNIFILIVIGRSLLLIILTRQTSLSTLTFDKIQLLSAAFSAFILLLFTLDGLLSSPVSTNYAPILLVFFCAASFYLLVPKPIAVTRDNSSRTVSAKQRNALQQIQVISRLLPVRVNILAAIIMLFARSSDRWTIGIVANVLVFAAINILAYIRLREAGQ